MFAYMEKDSFLHRRNPIIKLVVVLLITVVVSLSFYPVLPAVTFLFSFVTIGVLGKIPMGNLIKRLLGFLFVSFTFMMSMLIIKGLDGGSNTYLWWIFQWNNKDFIQSFALGFRILALVTLSMGFVLTTRPADLVMSLILQCKVPDLHGYSALAAYRFLPELQDQVDQIHLAHEIRGIPWKKGLLSRLTSPFRVLLPLLCVAARRGERVACAMESRGLGGKEQRTYYNQTTVNRDDWLFLIGAVMMYGLMIVILAKCNMFQYSFEFTK